MPLNIFIPDRCHAVFNQTIEEAGLTPVYHGSQGGPIWGVKPRFLPQGEYDCEYVQEDGVEEEEVIDSGDDEIRAGQGDIQFNSIAKAIGEAGSNHAIYFAVKLAEEAEKADAGYPDSDCEDDESSNSSGDSDAERKFSFAGKAQASDGPKHITTDKVHSTSSRGAKAGTTGRAQANSVTGSPGNRGELNAAVNTSQCWNPTHVRASPRPPEEKAPVEEYDDNVDKQWAIMTLHDIRGKLAKVQDAIIESGVLNSVGCDYPDHPAQ